MGAGGGTVAYLSPPMRTTGVVFLAPMLFGGVVTSQSVYPACQASPWIPQHQRVGSTDHHHIHHHPGPPLAALSLTHHCRAHGSMRGAGTPLTLLQTPVYLCRSSHGSVPSLYDGRNILKSTFFHSSQSSIFFPSSVRSERRALDSRTSQALVLLSLRWTHLFRLHFLHSSHASFFFLWGGRNGQRWIPGTRLHLFYFSLHLSGFHFPAKNIHATPPSNFSLCCLAEVFFSLTLRITWLLPTCCRYLSLLNSSRLFYGAVLCSAIASFLLNSSVFFYVSVDFCSLCFNEWSLVFYSEPFCWTPFVFRFFFYWMSFVFTVVVFSRLFLLGFPPSFLRWTHDFSHVT